MSLILWGHNFPVDLWKDKNLFEGLIGYAKAVMQAEVLLYSQNTVFFEQGGNLIAPRGLENAAGFRGRWR